MDDFDKVLRDLAVLERKLANPTPFYAQAQESYHVTAAAIAKRVIISMRPESESEKDWNHRAEIVANRLSSELLLGGGLAIFLDDPANQENKTQRTANAAAPNRDDIMEWVKAGIRGEPGGKRITAEDAQRINTHGVQGVAAVVRRAIYSDRNVKSYQRLRRAIYRYLSGSGDATADEVMLAVQEAWVQHFTPRQHRDLSRYVSKLTSTF